MTELDFFARIAVSNHALERARELIEWDDRQRIRSDIRAAILVGRVTDCQPNWTRGNGQEGEAPEETIWFAYDATATRCWVLTTRTATIYVKTLLLDHATERETTETRHLRHGFRRR